MKENLLLKIYVKRWLFLRWLSLIMLKFFQGYVKFNCRQYLNLIRLSFLNGEHFKALILCQECIKMTRQLDMQDIELESRLYQAHILLRLGYIKEALGLLKSNT
jgi:hypothetical protein